MNTMTLSTGLRTLLLTAASLSLLSLQAQAQSVRDAVDAALHNHPGVEAAQARIDASKADESEQFSGYFPQLNVGAQAGRIFGDNSTSRGLVVTRGEAYSGYGQASVSLTQPVLGMWQTSHLVDAAQARVEAADQSKIDVQEQLALLTSKTYVGILRGRELFAFLEDRISKMEDITQRIASAVKQGGADESEYQQARSMVLAKKSQMESFKSAFMTADAQYRELTGSSPLPEMEMPKVAINMAPKNIDEAVRFALEHSPMHQSALARIDAAQHDWDAEDLSLLPDINTEISYSQSDQRDEIGGETTDARALLKLNWDFSTGGGQIARSRKKSYEHKEALANASDSERQIERMVRVSYNAYGSLLGIRTFSQERESLMAKALKNRQIQFDGSRISLFELLGAQSQYTDAKLEAINAKYDVILAQYEILATLGVLRKSMGLNGEGDAVALTNTNIKLEPKAENTLKKSPPKPVEKDDRKD